MHMPFISDTWEDVALHLHCSDLPRGEASSQYETLSLKGSLPVTLAKKLCKFTVQVSWEIGLQFDRMMVLKRPFIGDIEENSALHIHCAGHAKDRA